MFHDCEGQSHKIKIKIKLVHDSIKKHNSFVVVFSSFFFLFFFFFSLKINKYIYITLDQPDWKIIVQELCESRGGRPELSVLTSLLASVDVKIY